MFHNYVLSTPERDGMTMRRIGTRRVRISLMTTSPRRHWKAICMPSTRPRCVYTFLLNLVTGNDTAGAKIQGLRRTNYGREAFKCLVKHDEGAGLGIHAINMHEADEVLKTLFYVGEKPPHMWWSEFEKCLTRALNGYVKRKGRIVHSDSMNIRMLIDKIKADFLTPPTKAQLENELSQTPYFETWSTRSIRHR